MGTKPPIEEVIAYAKGNVKRFISQFALNLPREQKEEIEANAFLRVWETYEKLDADRGWKSFIYNHCRGSVLDYLKAGNGFSEDRWSLKGKGDDGKGGSQNIYDRVEAVSLDGGDVDLDQILGVNEVFSESMLDTVKCNWDLIARMASKDKAIHCFALWLRGSTLETIGNGYGLSPQRVWAVIQELVGKFDDPVYCVDPWNLQTIYAFGLCEVLGVHNVDQSTIFGIPLGQNLEPINLDHIEAQSPISAQLGFEFA